MAFPQSRFATVDPSHPEAFAFCDRCNFCYNRSELVWQFDWRGKSLSNLRILVCKRTCLDDPQSQLRTIILGPDPVPIENPRPGFRNSEQGQTPVFSILELVDGDLNPPPPNDDFGMGTFQLDGYGNKILDGYGKPIINSSGLSLLYPDLARYPSDPTLLPPGAVYTTAVQLTDSTGSPLFDSAGNPLYDNSSYGAAIGVVAGITPNPLIPPIVFGTIGANSAAVKSSGGGNIQLTPGPPGSGIFYNSGGFLYVS